MKTENNANPGKPVYDVISFKISRKCGGLFMFKSIQIVFNALGYLMCSMSILVLSGCAGVYTSDHPLDQKILDTTDGKYISESETNNLIASADVVYLGEVHDNPWHHQIQLDVIRTLVASGRKPAVGMEMFSNSQTSHLMAFADGFVRPDNAGNVSNKKQRQLRKQLGWGKERDQEWAAYYPLMQQAGESGLPLFGIDLPAGIRRRITRVGLENLSPVEQRLITRTGFDNSTYQQVMYEEFTRGHCGWNDPALLQKLYQTWIARNDAMATAISDMLSTTENRPVIIIVGNGHTRHNMGVYERVLSLEPGVRQINIGLTPVQQQKHAFEDYIERVRVDDDGPRPAHELIWFTPSVDKEDPCIKYREQLKKHARAAS